MMFDGKSVKNRLKRTKLVFLLAIEFMNSVELY